MSNTEHSIQLVYLTEEESKLLFPITKASNTKITKNNENIPTNVVTLQDLLNALSRIAFTDTLTKSDVGLDNVGNFKAVSTVASQGLSNTEKANARANIAALSESLKGNPNGIAELDELGKVPSSQLPSYVDDVIEGYYIGGKFYLTEVSIEIEIEGGIEEQISYEDEIQGESGKIYIDKYPNKTYRWSGTKFVLISDTISLGETSSTAYRGDRGKIAYDHSKSEHARTDATNTAKSNTNGNLVINGEEINVYTHPSGTNPHSTTKSDVGLGNVGNFKAVSTEASQGLSNTEKANARTNIGAGTSSFSGSYTDLTNKPTIDNAFNETSENALQNKVVTSKMNSIDSYIDNAVYLGDAVLEETEYDDSATSEIDDSITTKEKTWSSSKLASLFKKLGLTEADF